MIQRLSSGLSRLLAALSRGVASDVYAAFVPVGHGVPGGAERFLDDLWQDAPIRVALATTVGAWFVALSPPIFLRRFVFFSGLSADERDDLLNRLMASDVYVVRLLFYGVKSMALVAVLRDPDSRRQLGLDAGP